MQGLCHTAHYIRMSSNPTGGFLIKFFSTFTLWGCIFSCAFFISFCVLFVLIFCVFFVVVVLYCIVFLT